MNITGFPFLFLFMPLIVLAQGAIRNTNLKNAILLIFSLLFYAWGDLSHIPVLLGVVLVDYGMTWIFEKKKNPILLLVGVLLVIAPLVFYKYFNDSLPLGISFYTFEALAYLFDVYREKIQREKNILYLCLYLAFYPVVSSGPILRYGEWKEQLNNRKISLNDIENGLMRFVLGLSKKILIADSLSKIADAVFALDVHVTPLNVSWIGAIAYMLQIYYDFSGYSDMAIGLGRMMGFHIPENFNNPYCSTSISEFWRRWHISLGQWFRDYVYIPLGGNRVSEVRWIFNMAAVWILTGIWHGSTLNYIAWGIYFLVLLLIEKKYLNRFLKKHTVLAHVYTLGVLLLGWIIFRISNVKEIPYYVFNLIDVRNIGTLRDVLRLDITYELFVLLIGMILFIPRISSVFAVKEENSRFKENIFIVLFVLCLFFIENGSFTTFLYFKF